MTTLVTAQGRPVTATSGIIETRRTAGFFVHAALQRLNVVALGEVATGHDLELGLQELNRMLKSWSLNGPNLWSRAEGTFPLQDGVAEYALGPRPRSVENVRFVDQGVERRPMTEWARNDWDRAPIKHVSGAPVIFVLDRQRLATTMRVWPTPVGSNGQWSINYSYERVLDDVTAWDQDIDVPQEWEELVLLALCGRLMEVYAVATPEASAARDAMRQRATDLFQLARDADRRGAVTFRLEGSYRR